MTTIIVESGSSIRIRFTDSNEGEINVDGEFEIHFDSESHRNQLVVKETAGLPGSKVGGANDILYCEEFDVGDGNK